MAQRIRSNSSFQRKLESMSMPGALDQDGFQLSLE